MDNNDSQKTESCASSRPDWVPDDAGEGFATRVIQGIPDKQSSATEGSATHSPRRASLSVDEYAAGVIARDRMILGRAITLIESNAPAHQEMAQQLLTLLLPHTGGSKRVGITGIPGGGKSTFIEAFGCHLTDLGHRVAVLAVDPSSSIHGGSILGDKVRMEKLSTRKNAFIRPSPSGGSLGGVARKTREAILVCEAAGYDVVLVETVGVGQNEVTVSSMVDLFLVLMIAGAGDEMQGIKKGVIELADAIVINKADGENKPRCIAAQAEMRRVLHYLQHSTPGWDTPALLTSSLTGEGIPEVWKMIEHYFTHSQANGSLENRRREQAVDWMHALIVESLKTRFYNSPAVLARIDAVEHAVELGQMPALSAALELISSFDPQK
jgi:LAO/AO transport system kinase